MTFPTKAARQNGPNTLVSAELFWCKIALTPKQICNCPNLARHTYRTFTFSERVHTTAGIGCCKRTIDRMELPRKTCFRSFKSNA